MRVCTRSCILLHVEVYMVLEGGLIVADTVQQLSVEIRYLNQPHSCLKLPRIRCVLKIAGRGSRNWKRGINTCGVRAKG